MAEVLMNKQNVLAIWNKLKRQSTIIIYTISLLQLFIFTTPSEKPKKTLTK